MNGALPNNPDATGKRRDRCAGGKARDSPYSAEYSYRNGEVRIHLP